MFTVSYIILHLLSVSGSSSTLATPLATNTTTSPSSNVSTETTSSSVEQEKYFRAVVSGTPLGNENLTPVSTRESLTSLDSLYFWGGSCYGDHLLKSFLEHPNSEFYPGAPSSRSASLSSRKRGFIRALSGLRGSGGKAACKGLRVQSSRKI